MAGWKLWTADDVRLLKKMYRDGHRVEVIADHFGRSRDAIKKKLSYLNVSRPKRHDGRGRRLT